MHRDFCEVVICEQGQARAAGRVQTTPQQLELFAQSLDASDEVVLEATGNALAIARILQPHVSKVVLANPKKVRLIAEAKVKTDKVDARVLAELLAAGYVPEVWIGDEATRALRRHVSRRRGIVKRRTALKNEVSSVLMRNLKQRPPMSDPFGSRGRAWLAALDLPVDERETIDACLRQLDFLQGELELADQQIAAHAVGSDEIRRLMTIPRHRRDRCCRVDGSDRRYPSLPQLAASGRLPRPAPEGPPVRQRPRPPRSDQQARIRRRPASALTEAAWAATKAPGPLRAFGHRIAARRGPTIAAVAIARKLAVLAWHLLTHEQDYAFQRPRIVQRKLRRLELRAGAPRNKPGPHPGPNLWTRDRDHEETAIVLQAEAAYQRIVSDWQATRPRRRAVDGAEQA